MIEWVSVTVPSGFTKDTWITSVQIKPEHPAVAHHICLGFNPHTPGLKYFDPIWLDKPRDAEGSAIPDKMPTFGPATPGGGFRSMAEDCYLPGNPVADYRDFQAAKLVPAGSDITLNLHYTPNGVAQKDRSCVGLVFARQTPFYF